MEEMIVRLSKTTKNDINGYSRQDNILFLEVGDQLFFEIENEDDFEEEDEVGEPLTLEITSDYDEEDDEYLLIISSAANEIGEIRGDKAFSILDAIKRDSVPVITVHELIENRSGTTSVNVKIVLYNKFEARERGLLTYEFHTKIAGVTQTNADGRPRQDIIATELQEEQELFLAREPENQYDPNAIAVITGTYSETVGYLQKKVAAEIAPQIDQHQLVTCQIKNITGLSEGDKSLGVNVLLRVYSLADTENIARNTAAKYQKETQSEPVEILPPAPEPIEVIKGKPQNEPTTSRFIKVNDPAEFITAPQTTAEKYQATSPVKKKPPFFSNLAKKIADWWRSRSKKTRIWIVVIVIVLLIGICGNMK
ncbi:MAG: hypothetical protein KBA03_03610 [Anaerolineaceae bacterium]|nr:hypothetical protein [Anaerolineaceae bacterium]